MLLKYKLSSDKNSFWIKIISKYDVEAGQFIDDKLYFSPGMQALSFDELKELVDVFKKYQDFLSSAKIKIESFNQEINQDWEKALNG